MNTCHANFTQAKANGLILILPASQTFDNGKSERGKSEEAEKVRHWFLYSYIAFVLLKILVEACHRRFFKGVAEQLRIPTIYFPIR